MEKSLILSVVGKISNPNFNKVKFKYEDYEGEYELLSIYFRNVLQKEGFQVKNVYFVPHSIYGEEGEILKLIKEVYKISDETYQLLLPSFGSMQRNGKTYKFINTYDFTRFYVFLNLINMYFNNSALDRIYVDINQGWNIYNDILKEAVRNFITFYKLMFLSEQKTIYTNLIFSEPILGSDNTIKEVFATPIDVKVFFDSPINKDDITMLENLGFSRKEIQIFKNFYRIFRAIKGNAPLIIFYFEYNEPTEIKEFIKNLVARFLEKIDPFKSEIDNLHFQIKYNIPTNIPLLINLFYSLALYYAISCELNKNGIKKHAQEWTDVKELSKIKNVYKSFGLYINTVLLNNDIKKLKELIKRNPIAEGIIRRYCELERKVKCINLRNFNIDDRVKRNFWAHSGFERNILLIKKLKGKLLLSYAPEVKDKLELFLK